ncbi:MAG: chitobiase/beta-hexosaminidase C-terminal domain-containing protein [Prevotella sp.]|nr:chitobiase/beta-hexosaminidase C-terminal domain-containing protein [Prevotella sp.]
MVKKMKYIKAIVAIVMCMVAVSVEASTRYVTLDLSSFERTGDTYLDDGILKVRGTATSTVLSELTGSVTVSFKCRISTSNKPNKTLVVSIVGGNESDPDVRNVTVASNSYQEESFTTTVSSTSKIQFSSSGTDYYINISEVKIAFESVAAPTFSLSDGYYKTAQNVTITDNEGRATIYYTTDGTEPTTTSTLYSSAIPISTPTTLKAIACKGGKSSAVTMAEYYVGSYIYAESFNNCNAAGGNDGHFSGKGELATSSNLDQSATLSNVYTANHCVFFETNGKYTLSVPDVGRSAVLSFRIAGSNRNSQVKTVNFVFQEKVGSSTSSTKTELSFTATNGEWSTITVPLSTIYNVETVKTIEISGDNFYLDDILLLTPETIALYDNASDSNSGVISSNDGEIRDVTINRTLPANTWCTMCLPFDIVAHDIHAAFQEGTAVETYTYTSFSSKSMVFTRNTTIEAGTPFLMRLPNQHISPTFRAVTIKNTPAKTITSGEVSFIGTYGPVALNTDGTDIFLDTNNNLHTPSTGSNTINGMRAFIRRTSNNVRIGLSLEDESAGISSVEVDDSAKHPFYTLGGLQVEAPTSRGIYVTRGRKVVIR